MTLLVVSVLVVLTISAISSLSEAAFYAVRIGYVRTLEETGSAAGRILAKFKQNMEQPIAAILIVNTVSNTAGAAIAGAQAAKFFAGPSLVTFSIMFTLSVLVFSEILPKVLGVAYNQQVARTMALPWDWIVRGMSPVIWIVESTTRVLKPNEPMMSAPEEEVEQMVRMSAEEGSIWNYEAEMVRNVLQLDDIRARQIMTPRPVVLGPEGKTVNGPPGRWGARWRASQPVARLLLSTLPRSIKSMASKWLRVPLDKPAAWTMARRFDW